jgi:predicted XRE-type DNA-binding protein
VTMNERDDDLSIESSSGNVFADIGLPNPEEYLIKAELTRQIAREIKRRRLTQARAADLLGIDQPKVSALLRGRLDGFSVERLLRFLTRLGQDVDIVVRRPAESGREGRVTVTVA